MNEKIKELIEKATTRSIGYAGTSGYPIVKFDKEKFAELIVRECIDIVSKEHDEGIDRHGDYQLALYEVYRAIKEHFGVEE